ncbi:MAG: hypothetical protein IJS79_00345 [Oscillospiraceae bacterium]|nr:hypothetical protein [Oscillospiraceae bacterium]MDO4861042.1 hypothetical protein [Eubacteriales bacterium]HAJ66209.1 hypothetical protein [Clostridiales bacterium]
MFKRMKNIRPSMLISHLIITLVYPLAAALRAEQNRLLVFTDAMTIVSLLLVIVGIIYSLVLHGDFDVSNYYLQHSGRSIARRFAVRRGAQMQQEEDIAKFISDAREKREGAFNYPLFLGIVYLLAAVIIAYVFYP